MKTISHLRLKILGVVLIVIVGLIGLYFFLPQAPIKIGILHSLTGSLALSEKPIIDAELMAIDEINAAGGLLKRKIVPIIVDGKSDEAIFAQEAQRLIEKEKVAMIIGCWSSSSRKMVQPIVEKFDSILIYPVSYEGLEESKNILNTGATQNQQIVPAVLWSLYNLGKRFFLAGSENIFSHMTNEIIKVTLASTDAQIVGQNYLLVGSTTASSTIDAIIKAQPEVIINTLHGVTNLAFFKELRARGITPEKIPVMTISSVSEVEFSHIGSDAMAGDYVTANYFQSIDREENTTFVTNYKKKYGQDRVVSESEEAAYVGIYFWADAVREAHTSEPSKVKNHLFNRVFNGPSGIMYTDNHILNTWKMIYVGKLRSDGQFTIVWGSQKQVQPVNFPPFLQPEKWEHLMNEFYELWGNRWSKIAG